LERTAHLLRSLKHPDEVEALRRVYGPGFFLLGLNSEQPDRFEYLTERKGMSPDEARRLIQRDQSEEDPFGQQTRDTFTLADAFLAAGDEEQLARFIELIFGHPFHTPTIDEHAMFLAHAASLRSAQLARQVGAVVLSEAGEVIGTGVNEVPKFGGGQYWPGEDDRRDHVVGQDSNDSAIEEILDDTVDRLKPVLELVDTHKARGLLAGGRISDLTEFGRVVHAEMEAILACGRNGVSARGGTLYTTTFPCHNCAKHLIAAGVRRVIYVEPYPKSRALSLHQDSIAFHEPQAVGKVLFLPFVGIAARRYFDLFSMRLSAGLPLKRKDFGRPVHWTRGASTPRIRMSPWSYLERERIAVEQIDKALDDIK
jgi:deoxycytidylate deaminase